MFLSSSRNREGQSSHWAFSTAPSLFSDLGDQRDPTLQYTRPQRGPDAECSSPCFHGLKSTDGCITLAAAAAAECAIHQGPTDAAVLRRRRRGVTLPSLRPSLSFTPASSSDQSSTAGTTPSTSAAVASIAVVSPTLPNCAREDPFRPHSPPPPVRPSVRRPRATTAGSSSSSRVLNEFRMARPLVGGRTSECLPPSSRRAARRLSAANEHQRRSRESAMEWRVVSTSGREGGRKSHSSDLGFSSREKGASNSTPTRNSPRLNESPPPAAPPPSSLFRTSVFPVFSSSTADSEVRTVAGLVVAEVQRSGFAGEAAAAVRQSSNSRLRLREIIGHIVAAAAARRRFADGARSEDGFLSNVVRSSELRFLLASSYSFSPDCLHPGDMKRATRERDAKPFDDRRRGRADA